MFLTPDQKKCIANALYFKYDDEIDEKIDKSLKSLFEPKKEMKLTPSFDIVDHKQTWLLDISYSFIDSLYAMLFVVANTQNTTLVLSMQNNDIFAFDYSHVYESMLTYQEGKPLISDYKFFRINFLEASRKYRYLLIPFFLLFDEGTKSHANSLMYDVVNETLERFEPHGSFTSYYDGFDVDRKITEFFRQEFPDFPVKYISPIDVCPTDGFQTLQCREACKSDSEPGGFCAIWSSWYMYMRVKNPGKTQEEVIYLALKKFKTDKISMHQFIRRYYENVKKFSFKYIVDNLTLEMIKKYGDVSIYTIPDCKSCQNAKKLLNDNGVTFKEINIYFTTLDEIKNYDLGKTYQKPSDYLTKYFCISEDKLTYPVIFIKNAPLLGGWYTLSKLRVK